MLLLTPINICKKSLPSCPFLQEAPNYAEANSTPQAVSWELKEETVLQSFYEGRKPKGFSQCRVNRLSYTHIHTYTQSNSKAIVETACHTLSVTVSSLIHYMKTTLSLNPKHTNYNIAISVCICCALCATVPYFLAGV